MQLIGPTAFQGLPESLYTTQRHSVGKTLVVTDASWLEALLFQGPLNFLKGACSH